MWRYLKSAFLVRVGVPGLGQLPVNVLLASAFGILGFAQPAFWLLGLAAQAAVVPGLAFNPRFQKYVQGQQGQSARGDDEAKRQALVELLDDHARSRLDRLASNCARILEIFRTQEAEEYIIDSNRDALNRLLWVYLKLLVARHHLLLPADHDTESTLQHKISAIDHQLEHSRGPDSLRESRVATRSILKKRLANSQRRAQTLAEIDSDLTRFEAQVDLILENATMQSKPQTITADLELSSNLGGEAFGDHEAEVCALDSKYCSQKARPAPLREAQ